MGAELAAKAAMSADHGFPSFLIPKHRTDGASFNTHSTADALLQIHPHPYFGFVNGIHRASGEARGVLTSAANHHYKPALHPTRGSHRDGRTRQASFPEPARTRERTEQTIYTTIDVHYRKPPHRYNQFTVKMAETPDTLPLALLSVMLKAHGVGEWLQKENPFREARTSPPITGPCGEAWGSPIGNPPWVLPRTGWA